jgi:hypothetical protein
MWHHQIDLVAILNPDATAAPDFLPRDDAVLRNLPPAAAPGGAGPSRTVPTTYLDLVGRLSEQRKRLVIWMDSGPAGNAKKQVLLDSPGLSDANTTLPSDALHGPQCLVHWMIPDGSNMSLSMGLTFHTWVPVAKSRYVYVLDHRWTYRVTHDQDFYATHIISGNVTFNVGVLQHKKLTPDLVRSQIVGHKVPLGFQRVKPEVVMYSDGSGFSYDIVDVQKAVNFPLGSKYRATRIVIENTKETMAGVGVIERFLAAGSNRKA